MVSKISENYEKKKYVADILGYARVSTHKQELDLQRQSLKEAGAL